MLFLLKMGEAKQKTTTKKEPTEENAKRQYALSFILKSSLNTEETDKYRVDLNEKIQKYGGKVTSSVCSETPNQLVYTINKDSQGYFCECVFEAQPDNLKNIRDELSNDPQIIRHLLEAKQPAPKKLRKRTPKAKIGPDKHEAIPATKTQEKKDKREKVDIEDIEKKLDEIIENI